MSNERRLQGLGVSPGIAMGAVYVRDSQAIDVVTYDVGADGAEAERQRLKQAVATARRQIKRLGDRARRLHGEASDEMQWLFEAYLQMLKDSRLVRGADQRIADDHINAEAAVQQEVTSIAREFAEVEDSYIAARLDDIREIGARLVRNLTKATVKPYAAVPMGSIVIAEQLTPADMAQIDPVRIAGAVAVLGGVEGHAAILARALGIPAVLGVTELLPAARSAESLIIDGQTGVVILDPSAETLARYQRRHDELARETKRLERLRDLPSVTRDDVDIGLQANVELPVEMTQVENFGAAGIGLLRTEFMYMNRPDLPDEDEQVEMLMSMIEVMGDRPITVRTLDIGAEKPADPVLDGFDDTAASALGLRGIRLSFAKQDLLETQFRAILRAAKHGNLRILLPMVSRVAEVRKARDLLKKTAVRMKRRKIPMADELPPLGTMIEVPGAALAADALAQHSDFFAIGSNDLTMYTLAIDRANEHVAHLYDPLHPAVLRLIQFANEAALRARKPVSICGEMAGDPRYAALLIGLGLRELSMTAANIPRVKQRIRGMELQGAMQRARLIMDQTDSGHIATLLDDFNALK